MLQSLAKVQASIHSIDILVADYPNLRVVRLAEKLYELEQMIDQLRGLGSARNCPLFEKKKNNPLHLISSQVWELRRRWQGRDSQVEYLIRKRQNKFQEKLSFNLSYQLNVLLTGIQKGPRSYRLLSKF